MVGLFLGNFHFEHELSRPTGDLRFSEESGNRCFAWLAVCGPDDAIYWPNPSPRVRIRANNEQLDWELFRAEFGFAPRITDDLTKGNYDRLIPWGWTPRCVRVADRLGISVVSPPLELVREINHRGYRFRLEEQFRVSLPGSALVSSIDQVIESARRLGNEREWILKAGYGMSGRERWLGRGPVLPPQFFSWFQRRLITAGVFVFEPRLEPLAEYGVQIEVPMKGAPELIGVTRQIIGTGGVHLGSQCGDSCENLSSGIVVCSPIKRGMNLAMEVATILQQEGYFGPLGIDMMEYRDESGQKLLRPLQDLNARWTMGRLALAWGESSNRDRYSWIHLREPLPVAEFELLKQTTYQGRHARVTSPIDAAQEQYVMPSILLKGWNQIDVQRDLNPKSE